MPNWCQNKLEIVCDPQQTAQIKSMLFTQMQNGHLCLDFNRLVPMPESLNIECSSSGNFARDFLMIPSKKRLSLSLIKRFLRFRESEIDRIAKKAKHHRWTVGNFRKWLLKRPQEQEKLYLNLQLGQQYIDNLAQYGDENWYDWNCRNWGCKWNVNTDNCAVTIHPTGDIDCFFDTPWCPPEAWFSTLCQTFPDVQFTLSFFESGMWFAGEYIANLDGSYSEVYVEDDEIRSFAEDVFGEVFEDDEID